MGKNRNVDEGNLLMSDFLTSVIDIFEKPQITAIRFRQKIRDGGKWIMKALAKWRLNVFDRTDLIDSIEKSVYKTGGKRDQLKRGIESGKVSLPLTKEQRKILRGSA